MAPMIKAKKKALAELIKKMRLLENKGEAPEEKAPLKAAEEEEDLPVAKKPKTEAEESERDKKLNFFKGGRKPEAGSPRIIIAAKFSPKLGSGRKLGRPSRKA